MGPACTELRHFLDRNQVTFTWVQPEEAGCGGELGRTAPSEDDLPVIRLLDGTTLARPQLRRAAELLGLAGAIARDYDTIVIGAGPAGLAAGVYGARRGSGRS